MLRAAVAILLALLASRSAGAEPLATMHRSGVSVSVSLERGEGPEAVLAVVFTPDAATPPLHLYSTDLTGTIGVATRIAVQPASLARTPDARLRADRDTHLLDGLAVYPEGPVTLRLPLQLPWTSDGAPVAATLLVSYMACSSTTCLLPVTDAALAIRLPSLPRTGVEPSPSIAATAVQEAVAAALEQERARTRQAVQEAVAAALEQEREQAHAAIRWRRAATATEAEALIAEARARGRPAVLDFTGPSCVNCQQMARTVLRLPEVATLWNRAVPIEISTDPPHQALAAWQQERFRTQARPLYVRLDADGRETRWSEAFSPADRAARQRFLAFLAGGDGSDAGTGQGLWQFLLLAVAGGLFTLLMPCTYPMIPFTVNFFAKQAAAGRSVLPLAAFYAAGIIACFVGLGVLVTGVFGASLATLAGHPVTNLLIAALFIVFGLSLLGVWFLHLPAGLADAWGGGRAGYAGALAMGLTFALTAFTCTAPFAGTVLAQAVATGQWRQPVLGMALYASAIAVPFFLLALSPRLLTRLPRAGAWMNEFKVVGGIVELAAALKFLVICDAAWGWGIIGRDATLALWGASAVLIALYVLGLIRLHDDQRLTEVGPGRLLTALAFLALGLWLAAGLLGHDLGMVECFFPEPG